MKTTKLNIFKFILASLALVMFFSCDNPTFLGTMLDIEGPVVEIVSPAQRQSVPVRFELEGTVWDNSGVKRMIIKAVSENEEFPRQWRYQRNEWEVSSDYGKTWSKLAKAVWETDANNTITWKIPVDMELTGQEVKEGEYTFNVQAWDNGEFTSDNSFKAVVLIVDLNPPKVDVSYPFMYRNATDKDGDFISPLKELHEIPDNGSEKQDPAYLGKFLTQEFELKWQIEDLNDVWSIDLRFYYHDTDIDNNHETDLPSDYIYKFFQNLPPVPVNINPADYIKPNGSVIIPDLTNPAGIYEQGGEIKTPITTKTTLKVVAVCYDAAGNPNQEKTLGYFVYWPAANAPWIAFAEGMEEPNYGAHVGNPSEVPDSIEPLVYTVFPSRYIKATAYQAHGVKKVEYSVLECNTSGNILSSSHTLVEKGTKYNTPNSAGMYSTIFPIQFDVPPLTGYYVIKATAFSEKDKPSYEYEMLFRVNDITFPMFIVGPFPEATKPLFLNIVNNEITISGLVDDASEIESLCLSWINPESEDYKAMSQLAYFRDKDYPGWQDALKLAPGTWDVEKANSTLYPGKKYPYDPDAPNKLWNLKFKPCTSYVNSEGETVQTPGGIDPYTNRHVYEYSQKIDLDILNIGMKPGQSPLKSQVFLLRAENPGKRCTIITYAPQGDTVLPEIKIETVTITPSSGKTVICRPNQYVVIPKFDGTETITVTGSWIEDSLEVLDIDTYFKNNFIINVNNRSMPKPTLKKNDPLLEDEKGGYKNSWTITTYARATPGTYDVPLSSLKDTLVIDAKTNDIGGNVAEIGNSWLIQSDNLRLMRISSEMDDGTYTYLSPNNKIEIFLEFSKPVKLAYPDPGNKYPELILSTAGGVQARATYKQNQINQNSRQYFEYTVASGQNTTSPDHLNVTGLYFDGKTYDTNQTNSPFTGTSYPFAWSRGADSEYEEVRLTMQTGKDDTAKDSSGNYYVRTLPTSTTPSDPSYQFTLFAAKNIKVDTTPPTVLSISANTAPGWYSSGDIYFTVTFSESVAVGATPPSLPIRIGTNTSMPYYTRYTDSSDVRVNGDKITFKYHIGDIDSSAANQIYVSSGNDLTGIITDLAGNALAVRPLTSLSQTARTLNGIYLEAADPENPTVRIYDKPIGAEGSGLTIQQNVSGANRQGVSGIQPVDLSNVYQNALWLEIEGAGAYKEKYEKIEYSLDGINWITAPNTDGTRFSLDSTRTGDYKITARQTDKAGNVSVSTNPISFNWEPAPLITRISSTNANGVYTHNTGRDTIDFTIYFRKALSFNVPPNTNGTTPQITLNSTTRAINTYNIASDKKSITFTYKVVNGDNTPTSQDLDILTLSGITAWDGASSGNGVNVSSLVTLPSGTPKLDSSKKFTVETGNLTIGTLDFAPNGGTGDNFHGINEDDGSYWTTLLIPFNHNISKGSGIITITQEATNYRLPAVITETQYNRLKSRIGTLSNGNTIDTFYIKGTNGFKYTSMAASASDTSTKYILQYKYDPDSTATTGSGGFSDNTAVNSTFINAFRLAEAISINVNAQAVEIGTTTGAATSTVYNTLRIRLTGSSAPQVPGATYTVNLDNKDIITDSLGNSINSYSTGDYTVTLRGVAKPFVRIKKTQDTISINTATPSLTRARLEANQPFLANARIDCRTPGSTITYTATTGTTDLSANTTATHSNTENNNNWQTTYGGNYTERVPNNTNNDRTNWGSTTTATNNNTYMLASRPGNATTTTYNTNNKQITFGYTSGTTSPDITDVQGFQWWVRTRASRTISGTTTNSLETEEVAYRTVISYTLRNANGAITGTLANGYSIMENGDQIWIRGGDGMNSSSVPGFPFTWEDNFNNLSTNKQRAGIRLMTLVSYTTSMNNSLWRFVTWDMNTTAYVDFIKGHDVANDLENGSPSADVAWQYGPKRLAYQRDGWVSQKDRYPIYAGKHRWVDCGWGWPGSRQQMNFSGTLTGRPTLDATIPSDILNRE
jgi:hypothetical protein